MDLTAGVLPANTPLDKLDVGQLALTTIVWDHQYVKTKIMPKQSTCLKNPDTPHRAPKAGKTFVRPSVPVFRVSPGSIACVKAGIEGNYFVGVVDLVNAMIYLCPLVPASQSWLGATWYPTDTPEMQLRYWSQRNASAGGTGWLDPTINVCKYRPRVMIRDNRWANPITHMDLNGRLNSGGRSAHEHLAELVNRSQSSENGKFAGFTIKKAEGNSIRLFSFTSRSQHNSLFDILPEDQPAPSYAYAEDESLDDDMQAHQGKFNSVLKSLAVKNKPATAGGRVAVEQTHGQIGQKWAKAIIRGLASVQFFEGAVDGSSCIPAEPSAADDYQRNGGSYVTNAT